MWVGWISEVCQMSSWWMIKMILCRTYIYINISIKPAPQNVALTKHCAHATLTKVSFSLCYLFFSCFTLLIVQISGRINGIGRQASLGIMQYISRSPLYDSAFYGLTKKEHFCQGIRNLHNVWQFIFICTDKVWQMTMTNIAGFSLNSLRHCVWLEKN